MARKSKASRKASRKGRKASKGSRRVRRMRGGNPMALSLAQGAEYLKNHEGQRGGGSALMGAPLDYDSMLPGDLRTAARIDVLDKATNEIAGMSDMPSPVAPQAGGSPGSKGKRRRKSKASRKGRKASRKGRKASKKVRKASRKGRRGSKRRTMKGGAKFEGAPYNSPNMLLSPQMAARAGTADFSNPLLKL